MKNSSKCDGSETEDKMERGIWQEPQHHLLAGESLLMVGFWPLPILESLSRRSAGLS